MLTVLRRLFDFSSWETNHPGSPPPGDWLDASFDAQNQRIMELEALLDSVRRSDGRLQNGIVSKDSLDPDFFVQLSAKIAQIGEILLENARLERQKAENAAQVALFAAQDAENNKIVIKQVESDAAPFHQTLQTSLQTLSEQVEIARSAASAAQAAVTELDGMESYAGYSEAWARTSAAWAEHMPDTIPDNFMQVTDISGDHWSSRWWANRAAHSFGMLVEFYLGAHPNPPTTGLDGGPIDTGSIYYDTDDGRAYVWNGSAWVPLWTPAQSNTLSLWYAAAAAQTAFPTATPDINGNSFVIDNAHPQGVEVHVNGLLKEPDLSGPGGDYTINTGTSTVTFNAGLTAGDRVAIDIMTAPDDMRPGAMNAWAMTVAPAPDGVLTVFAIDVVDPTGPATATVGRPEELLVSVDGVVQKPGDDYQAAGATLTFSTPPAADSIVFATWFQALGGSPTGDMTPAEILAALKTVDGPASGIDADLLDGQHGAFFAPIASPTFTGDPRAPTPATADNDTSIATTAFVVAKLAASGVGGAPAWADITGKPATFPPTVPIAQADITNLTADLAGKVADTGDTMTGTLVLNGTQSSAAPALTFATANCGLWGTTTAVVMATVGAARLTINSTSCSIVPQIRESSGAVGTPGYSWTSDTDAGFYLSAAGDMRLAMAGADVVKWLDDKSTTFSGQLVLKVGDTTSAPLNFPSGVAPTTPAIGDVWFTGTSLNYRISGATYTIANIQQNQTFTGIKTFSTKPIMATSTTTTASVNVPHGVALTSAWVDGDIWSTSTGGFYGRVNGVTKNLSIHVGTTAPASPITNDLWLDTN